MQNFKVKKLNLEEVNASLLSLEDATDEANEKSANTFLTLNSYLSVLQTNLSVLQNQYTRLVYYRTIFEMVLAELNAQEEPEPEPTPEEEDEDEEETTD